MVSAASFPGADVTRDSATAAAGLARRWHVCILSDDLSGEADEGVKKFTVALAAALSRQHAVGVISTQGPTAFPWIRHIPASRTLFSMRLRAALARDCPDVLIYATRKSATFFSFLRCRLLKAYCPGATTILLGLQTRRHTPLQRRLIRHLLPDLVCVQSEANRAYLERLGCAVALAPSGVNLDTFRPAPPERRSELRARYGLRPEIPVVLHVGHLTAGRRIGILGDLAEQGGYQVVLVASSSTVQESALAAELRRAGVVVLTEYQPQIEHFYQLADCYVFPVTSTDNAIEAPLSVLEALACNLPVVTTRFGGLPRMFAGTDHPGLVFVDSPADIVARVRQMCAAGPWATRELVAPYSWEAVATALLERALAVAPSR